MVFYEQTLIQIIFCGGSKRTAFGGWIKKAEKPQTDHSVNDV